MSVAHQAVSTYIPRVSAEENTYQDVQCARRWLMVSVGALIMAGLFSLIPLVGRIPVLSQIITDPLFAKRCLVIHVNLALVIWIYAFVASLFYLIPGHRISPFRAWLPVLAISGVSFLILSGGLPSTQPVLSNYIPMIDHPLFVTGLVIFAIALAGVFLEQRLWAGQESQTNWLGLPIEAAYPGLRAAAIACLFAFLTFWASWLTTPTNLPVTAYYESLMWGGGHILQFASVAGMVSVWLILLTQVLGKAPLSRRTTARLFGIFLLPIFIAPILALQGTVSNIYHTGFTQLMQWGIFPMVLTFLGLSLKVLYQAWRQGDIAKSVWREAAFIGFIVSASLTVLGFILGSQIRGSNTVIPAHYHASIGGVTASFMAMTYLLLKAFSQQTTVPKRATLQLKLFGLGQFLFACGFGYAGIHGMSRKVYGSEQHIRSLSETLGLGLMGVGGLLAIAGGLLFLGLAVSIHLKSSRIQYHQQGEV